MVDSCYIRGLGLFNPFESSVHAFSRCSVGLVKLLEAENSLGSYQARNTFCDNGKPNHMSNGREQCMPYITTCDSWCPSEILMEIKCTSKIRCTSQVFVSSSINISPFSYPIYEEFVFLDGTSQFASLKEFISNLKLSFQTMFQGCSLDMHWVTGRSNKSGTLQLSEIRNESYDATLVPDFLCNIPMESWLSLEPDITISRNIAVVDHNSKNDNVDQTSSLHYDKVAFSDYIMSKRELTYFSKEKREKSFLCCLENDLPICILKINGIIVGEAGVCKWPENERKENRNEKQFDYVAVFRTDLLSLAILQIDDIRLFWSRDNDFQTHLRQSMVCVTFMELLNRCERRTYERL